MRAFRVRHGLRRTAAALALAAAAACPRAARANPPVYQPPLVTDPLLGLVPIVGSTLTYDNPVLSEDFSDATNGIRVGQVPLGVDPNTILMIHADSVDTQTVAGSTLTLDSANSNHLFLVCKQANNSACSATGGAPQVLPNSFNSSAFSDALNFVPGPGTGATEELPLALGPSRPSASTDQVYSAGAFTLEAWFSANPPSGGPGGSGTYVIAGQGIDSPAGRQGYYLGISTYGASGQAQVSLVGFVSGTYVFSSTIPFNLSAGVTWAHAALSYDGATARLYLNGTLINSAPATLAQPPAGTYFSVGSLTNTTSGTQYHYYGWIDDIRLEKVALNADQIASDYFSGAMRYSLDSPDGAGGTWTYIMDPLKVNLQFLADLTGLVHEATSTVSGAFFNSCSRTNWAAFLSQDTRGNLSVSSPFNILVDTYLPNVAPIPAGGVAVNSINWTFSINNPCTFGVIASTETVGVPPVVASTFTLDTTQNNSLSLPMAGLTPNTSYTVLLQAFNSFGATATVAASTYTLAAAPTGLSMSFVSSQTLAASWATNGNPSYTQYIVSYGRVGVNEATSTVVTTSSFTYLSSYASGLHISSSTAHFMYVQAFNQFGHITANTLTASTTTLGGFQQGSFHPQDVVDLGGLLAERLVSLVVSSGTFEQNYTLTIVDTGTAPCGPVVPGGSTAAIRIAIQPTLQPKLPLTLSIGYKASEAAGATAGLLSLVRYDEATGVCVPLVTQVDPLHQTLTAEINHMSTYQMLQQPPAPPGLDAARVFPNPLFLSRGQGYFTLRQVPAGTRIKIYTLRGELVYDMTADSTGSARWNAVNGSGFGVASGVYLAILDTGSNRKVLKLAVER